VHFFRAQQPFTGVRICSGRNYRSLRRAQLFRAQTPFMQTADVLRRLPAEQQTPKLPRDFDAS
jgi:hypothetical protein